MKRNLVLSVLISCTTLLFAQEVSYNSPKAGNPIIPGYFADPTVRKFGDTYYIYATTDGNGGGLGPSQVWTSKDFVNWTIEPMNWPSTYHIWAPDVMKYNDKYYMYYCEPCQIYCGVSDSPTGPWTNILGDERAVLVRDRFVKNAITLDGQSFVDDDGSVYLYWGTWGIYEGFGCGAGKLNPDMKSFAETKLILNTEVIDFFEAPFVFKRNGIYYFTYSSGSCHDHTYRVQYATSTEGPLGPYKFADNNPILETSADRTIHGPGHHSILQEGDDYYIVYHRHDIPNSTRGMHRQIAADKLTFDAEGRIEKIKAGHEGIGFLQKDTNPYPNLAFGKKVKASSCYNDNFEPEYAVDDNNATLWRPKSCGREWIEIDFGEKTKITRVWTQFEYATSFYQYLLETSNDGITWTTFADRTNNTFAGSPMMDEGKAKARYLRLTFTGSEVNGRSAALWNIKVFNKGKNPAPMTAAFNGQSKTVAPQRQGLVFDINADDYPMTEPVKRFINRKDKSQGFNAQDNCVPVRPKAGKSAFIFNGEQEYRSDFPLPATFLGNAPYTLLAWIYMDKLTANECIVDLTTAGGELEKVSLGFGTDPKSGIVNHNGDYENMGISRLKASSKWQLLAVTFDGYMEKIYIDGKLVKEKDIVLRLPESEFITVGQRLGDAQAFKNALHSLTLYDTPMDAEAISKYFEAGIPDSPMLHAGMNDLNAISSTPEVQLLSPYSVKVGVNLPVNEYALSFNYENLTTGTLSGWISDTKYTEYALQPNTTYHYRIQVKDAFGNSKLLDTATITTSEEQFYTYADDFSTARNYFGEGTKGTIWDGFTAYKPEEVKAEAVNGELKLTSASRNFQQSGQDNGPLLYREVAGDFLAQVKVTDFTGMKDHRAVGYNEGGLMVLVNEAGERRSQNLMHLGIFPHYNVGNILTDISRGRVQYKNDKGWAMDYYLQVERCGENFHFRSSADGKTWNELPGSPLKRKVAEGKKLKVGLYQTTYTDSEGYVSFDDFKLWIRK